MPDNNKEHFWIPENEVQKVPKKPTSRPKPRDVSFTEHGSKLSQSLQAIQKITEDRTIDNSLADLGLCVLKVELMEGEKVQAKTELFSSLGFTVNAIKDDRNAIVSATTTQFEKLQSRIETYKRKGEGKTHFDCVDDFKPFIGDEKNSSHLKQTMYAQTPPEKIDVQIMLIPNMKPSEYSGIVQKLVDKLNEHHGDVQNIPYLLSDNTPVIRAIIPSSSLVLYTNDFAIYRIEETNFFSSDTDGTEHVLSVSYTLDESVVIEQLPIVAVLDSGVSFISPFDSLIMHHWLAPSSMGGNKDHGTKVASKVAFRDLGNQLLLGKLSPRARIVDCNILDGSVSEDILIQRIQAAVTQYGELTQIFNLSANALIPIEGDEISIIGYELDALQLGHNIQFVVSAGNHKLWQNESSLEEMLDDDDTRIAAPADSMHSIVVGSVVGFDHAESIAKKNNITTYSRKGPGFTGFMKPDISAYGGTLVITNGNAIVPVDDFSLVLNTEMHCVPDAGTSFTAPVVSGDLAEISTIVPGQNILLSKALLYHNAAPIWDVEDIEEVELAYAHTLYGRGISSVDGSKYSSPSKVTFVRTGELNKVTKERVMFYMPTLLASQPGNNTTKVTVTCLSKSPVDRTKGKLYLQGFVRASVHKNGKTSSVPPDFNEGRQKWDSCQQLSKTFSRFKGGDWQVWLELFTRWDDDEMQVPYALVITIEDLSGTLDIYNEIETQNRYQALNTLRVSVRS